MEKEKVNKKLLVRRVVIVAVLAVLAILLVSGIVRLITSSKSEEKVVGNLNNRGLVVQDGKVTFYNKYEKGIYRVRGNREDMVTDETAYSMTLYNDQIYYLTVSSSNTIDLKRVDITGENNVTLKTLYTAISKFYVDNGYVYYVSNKDTIALVKLNIEDNREITLATSNIQDFVLDGNKLFFTDNVGYLYSINTDGTNHEEISKEYPIKKIQIYKKWIYYYDENENALCKLKKDGSSREVVSKFVTNEIYNITNKGIFYFDEENKRISKSDLKGKNSVEIVTLDTTGTRINIAGDLIYYLDKSKDDSQIYQMYRVKMNGKATKEIQY